MGIVCPGLKRTRVCRFFPLPVTAPTTGEMSPALVKVEGFLRMDRPGVHSGSGGALAPETAAVGSPAFFNSEEEGNEPARHL